MPRHDPEVSQESLRICGPTIVLQCEVGQSTSQCIGLCMHFVQHSLDFSSHRYYLRCNRSDLLRRETLKCLEDLIGTIDGDHIRHWRRKWSRMYVTLLVGWSWAIAHQP